jgi:hypothetical protein
VTIVIAEEGDDTVRPYADHMIEIPAVSKLLQPLLSTIPLQVFAASVAAGPRLRRRQAAQSGQVGLAGNLLALGVGDPSFWPSTCW